jgi:hypothetical protein
VVEKKLTREDVRRVEDLVEYGGSNYRQLTWLALAPEARIYVILWRTIQREMGELDHRKCIALLDIAQRALAMAMAETRHPWNADQT